LRDREHKQAEALNSESPAFKVNHSNGLAYCQNMDERVDGLLVASEILDHQANEDKECSPLVNDTKVEFSFQHTL